MSSLAINKDKRASCSDDAYDRLREAIVTGRARPNERLVEAELAEWLEISRTPIRETLKRLAAEGLVASRRSGWVVREHTADEIREIYEVRAALEGYCARLAAQRATETQLAEIAALHGDNAKGASNRELLVNVNDRFHDAIISAANNERLSGMIRNNRTYYFNFRIAELYSDNEADNAIAGHDAIVQALQGRDAERAEHEMRSHVDVALKVILSKIR
jgi:DNA-binding GntR family transcriptional regulator